MDYLVSCEDRLFPIPPGVETTPARETLCDTELRFDSLEAAVAFIDGLRPEQFGSVCLQRNWSGTVLPCTRQGFALTPILQDDRMGWKFVGGQALIRRGRPLLRNSPWVLFGPHIVPAVSDVLLVMQMRGCRQDEAVAYLGGNP